MQTLLVSLLAGVLLSACGGASGNSSPAAAAASQACNAKNLPFVVLSYPLDGSIGVAPSVGNIVLAVQSGEALGSQVQLVAASGVTIAGSNVGPAPNPLPSPIATFPALAGSGWTYAGASIPTLAPSTAYQVKLVRQSCGALQAVGSFTTQ